MKDQIKEILKEAIEELNTQLEDDEQVAFNDETRFIGSHAAIDSISFVTLVSIIEEIIEDKMDVSIQLVNEKAFSSKRSPFYSIETMVQYIEELIKEEK
ncbi:hypothetical protein IJV79_02085 [bacterium]|nr:hypothetical protein [bacterium]